MDTVSVCWPLKLQYVFPGVGPEAGQKLSLLVWEKQRLIFYFSTKTLRIKTILNMRPHGFLCASGRKAHSEAVVDVKMME